MARGKPVIGKDLKIYITICLTVIISIIIFSIFGWTVIALYKKYTLWSYETESQAQVIKNEWNSKAIIREAEARKQAAIALSSAEIELAQGIAQANKIIGKSLNKNVLNYLWIDTLNNEHNKIIYVPIKSHNAIYREK